ncbi:MAG: ABC transporter permease [Terracidiphilus sp.]
MRSLVQDLQFALRQLRKTPGMAVLAVLTLALGIGANTAIFTVIQNVLLRPLPYPHADRLVNIAPGTKQAFDTTSWLNYVDIRNQSRLLEAVSGYSEDVTVVQSQDSSLSVVAPRVTPNLFSMLGVKPILGRTFTEAEGQTGGPSVAILNEGLWRETFHADPNIVGKTIRAGGIVRTVIGVLPASFQFPEAMGPDSTHNAIWFPLQPTVEMLKDRGYNFFNIIGELHPGATVAQFQHELDAIAARIPRDKGDSKLAFRVDPYQDLVTGPVRPVLYALLAALGLVLLIACANVSNLLIARCLARQQEFAVRAALGASRVRLVRQMLAEGLAISVLGCAFGLLFAQLSILALRKLPAGTIPRADTIAIHWSVVFTLAAIATLTSVLSSLLPGLLVARANPQAALQAASRGVGSRTVSGRLSGALVAGEVALSAVLLVGAGLLFHTLWNLEQANLGIDIERVTTFTAMPADAAGFSNMAVSTDTANAPPSVATLVYAPVLDRMHSLPGIEDAALATTLPFSGLGVQSSFDIIGRPKDPLAHTRVSAASSDFARVLGTPMVSGRMIADSDIASAPPVGVVNEAFAKKYFPGKNPDQAALGHQIDLGGKDTGMIQPVTIVGVMADQVGNSVTSDVLPNLLLPPEQIPTTSLFYQALLKTVVSFVVKTRGDIPITAEMRDLFRHDAPGYALDQFQTLREAVDSSTFSQRLGLYLVASFAGLAIAMVIAGLYGVLSQLVSYRRREIGVRMALGATRSSVAALVLRQASILVGLGLAAGLVIAVATGRLIASFLYQVHPLDGWTYAAVILALALVGAAASLLPARKAASIQPMQALREE